MAESEEALQLKRRARRRLVGAIALVTFVVIILPLILDKEPGPAGPPLSVQIPNQESGGFNTRVLPPAPAAPAGPGPEKKAEIAPAKAEVASVKAEPPLVKAELPAVKAELPAVKTELPAAKAEFPAVKTALPAVKATTPAAKAEPAEREVAKAPGKAEDLRAKVAPNAQAWVVTVDAFSDKKNVIQLRTKLSAAGVKSYTEAVKTSKGELTRVRAGPFASKEAAEQARAKLDAMGLKPGTVASR
jgi:DedD protein